MFHSFFNSLTRSRYRFFFYLSFNSTLWSAGTAKSTIWRVLFLFVCLFFFLFFCCCCCLLLLGLVVWSRLSDPFGCQNSRRIWVCHSSGLMLGFAYTILFIWWNFNFLHNSQWITLPTQSCLVLYSFCANLLHSLIMWLMVSYLSPHNQHLLFCCILSILAIININFNSLIKQRFEQDNRS